MSDTDLPQEYLALCHKPVLQDSHCKRQGGHEGPCRDGQGWRLLCAPDPRTAAIERLMAAAEDIECHAHDHDTWPGAQKRADDCHAEHLVVVRKALDDVLVEELAHVHADGCEAPRLDDHPRCKRCIRIAAIRAGR